MLRRLTISNYLFIETATLDFHEGLNVVVGESGVGKSMLVNILSIPLGFQPGSEVIGSWDKIARISMVFDSEELLQIEIGKKTVFMLKGETINAKKVREYFSQKLDVHSQNNYELIRGNHLAILDRFMTFEEQQTWARYQECYGDYLETRTEATRLRSLIFSESQRDYVEFQQKELSSLNLKSDEDHQLFEELKQSQTGLDYAKHFSELTQMMEELQGLIHRMIKKLSASEYPALQSLTASLQGLECEVDDVRFSLARKEQSSGALSAEEIAAIESRLDILEALKKKYRKSLPELIDFLGELTEQLDHQESYRHELSRIEKREEETFARVNVLAQQVSANREKISTRVIASLETYLAALGLDKTEIAPSFLKKSLPDETGIDDFRFLIRVNRGSAFHALHKLSGGETSRIMLSLKAGLRHACPVSTYIFDEIDSGVSGDIAEKVSEVIADVAKTQQVIVMTHLPILAAKGDVLFQMTKTFSQNQTHVSVCKISREEWVSVLATLVPDGQSPQSLSYIKSLLEKS